MRRVFPAFCASPRQINQNLTFISKSCGNNLA